VCARPDGGLLVNRLGASPHPHRACIIGVQVDSPGPPTRRRFLSAVATCAASGALGIGCSSAAPGFRDIGPLTLDIASAAKALKAGSLSPVELTEYCLDRIARVDRRLNAFITVTAKQARADARHAAHEIAAGRWRGPLHGIPIALKDNIDTGGVRTTAASAVFADRVPDADAAVVVRLREAGAILLGKLNLHEFALGTTSAISHAGPVHNPWDLERSAGGSSGGCGAAVAAGLCFGAIGTDTGGSIRIPAAACGVVGLKPTHGVVSLGGVVPISPSFDTVGPICRTVSDAALMFRALSDHPAARACDPEAFGPVATLRVGRGRTAPPVCDVEVAPDVQAVFDAAMARIRLLVASVEDVDVPAPMQFGAIIDAEAYAYHQPWLAAAGHRYDPRTKAVILAGAAISDAEYARLRDQLRAYRAARSSAFDRIDVMAMPTLPQTPLRLRDATDPFALGACTFPFSITGWPAVSVPCGFSAAGLPVGLLLAGPPLSEPTLLALARAYEQATPWHEQQPPFASI